MSKLFVLDLDNTLIHSPAADEWIPRSALSLRVHHVFLDDSNVYLIFERPFLKQFLQSLSGHKIAIWTAADEEYARFIVEHILKPYLKPNQKFEFVWARKQTEDSMKKTNFVKHLGYLRDKLKAFAKSDIVLVDDNAELPLQQQNTIYVIPPFTVQRNDDVELLRALSRIV